MALCSHQLLHSQCDKAVGGNGGGREMLSEKLVCQAEEHFSFHDIMIFR